MQLVAANPAAKVTGEEELPGKVNYFIGNDPSKWCTDVGTYAKVRYEQVYPGVDLVYYGNQRQLEYDFVVRPGADPARIRLRIAGAQKMYVDGRGQLVVKTPAGAVRWNKPQIYQEVDGQHRSVKGKYVLGRGHELGFEVASYDAAKPLVIDPTLAYSTYLGGSSDDYGYGIAVDTSGNAYVTGRTVSSDFPTTAGAFQTTTVVVLPGCLRDQAQSHRHQPPLLHLSRGRLLRLRLRHRGGHFRQRLRYGRDANQPTFPLPLGAFQTTYGGLAAMPS